MNKLKIPIGPTNIPFKVNSKTEMGQVKVKDTDLTNLKPDKVEALLGKT